MRELVDVVVGFCFFFVFVFGDFNVKNLVWGFWLIDVWGRMVEDWVLEIGLVVLNWGFVFMCVWM